MSSKPFALRKTKGAEKLCALCLALSLSSTAWAGDNDFGLWGEVAVTKRLPYNLSVGIEAEGRTHDNMQLLDRWNVGLNVGYKVTKWLKLGVGYSFIQQYKEHSRKEKYAGDDKYPERTGDPAYWNGYNLTSDYITPKHRLVAMATFTSPKIGKWIRLSLRERYQFTSRPEMTVDRWKYRYNYTPADGFSLKDGYPELSPTVKEARQRHSLRSRLKVEMDKKRIHWHPFVGTEIYNDPTDSFRLTDWRLTAGTSWDVTRNHSLSVAYIYNVERDIDGNGHQHVVSIGYDFKF